MTESFSNIKQVLNGVQFKNLNPVFAEIISNWDNIVGKKFEGKTELKDISLKNDKYFLYVNVKSSAILQELNFFKRNLIIKIKEKYNFQIEDIIIKLSSERKEHITNTKQTQVQEFFNLKPSKEELDKIILDENDLFEIKKSIEKQPALTDKQKERMFEVIEKDLKTQEWMKQKGVPVCKKCGRIITKKIFGEENICQYCKNSNA